MDKKRILSRLGILASATALFAGSFNLGYNYEKSNQEIRNNRIQISQEQESPHQSKDRLELRLMQPEKVTIPQLLHETQEHVQKIQEYKENLAKKEEQIKRENRIYIPTTEQEIKRATEALFAEARCRYRDEEYLKLVVKSFVTRAYENNQSIEEVITARKQYSYLNSRDRNKVKSGNAKKIASKNPIEMRAYETCERIVREILENGIPKEEFTPITHYFVSRANSNRFPSWATEDKLVRKIHHNDRRNNITRFYNLSKIS